MLRSTNAKYFKKESHEAFRKSSLHYQVIIFIIDLKKLV